MKLLFVSIFLLSLMSCVSQSTVSGSQNSRSTAGSSPPDVNFIFAFHDKIPSVELNGILSATNPTTVFVEIPPADFEQNDMHQANLEMIQALLWALRNHRDVYGFDCPMKTKPDSYSEATDKKIKLGMKEFDSRYSWRDGNRQSVSHELAVLLIPFTDPNKMDQRHECMLQNIRLRLPNHGKVLILTGAYHSDFFRGQFPTAHFPAAPHKTSDLTATCSDLHF
jgi:hypothetical protein